MPTYEHLCQACNEEFELEYSIKKDPPDTCPLCKTKGKIKRLISGCAGRVELGFNEFKEQAKIDNRNLRQEMKRNENLKANIIGESAYHNMKLKNYDV